jgi:citrate synthase
VESLPPAGGKGRVRAGARGDHETIAERLWLRSSAMPPAAPRIRALDVAMGLCADHALSPSTLAVRIAASQRADPYAVVQTGMGALSGALHGAASLAAEELLADVERTGDESAVIGARLRRGERIPGFGHALHPGGDPRAAALLSVLAQTFPRSRALDAALAVERTMRTRGLPPANVDFALAALARAAEMTAGSSEAIMAIARVSGWIAHALEEYAAPSVFPWHALYVGPKP